MCTIDAAKYDIYKYSACNVLCSLEIYEMYCKCYVDVVVL